MQRRFRAYWPDEDEWHWFELDAEGYATRHVVLRAGEPVVAVDTDEVIALRDRAGLLGVQLYEAVYGASAEGIVGIPPAAVPVAADEFDRTFREAVRYRNFVRTTTGPFPRGSLVDGTFGSNPWPSGVTGTYVDIEHGPVHGFVDAMWFRTRSPGQSLVPRLSSGSSASVRTHSSSASNRAVLAIRGRRGLSATTGRSRSSGASDLREA